jgi:hypothetical protein
MAYWSPMELDEMAARNTIEADEKWERFSLGSAENGNTWSLTLDCRVYDLPFSGSMRVEHSGGWDATQQEPKVWLEPEGAWARPTPGWKMPVYEGDAWTKPEMGAQPRVSVTVSCCPRPPTRQERQDAATEIPPVGPLTQLQYDYLDHRNTWTWQYRSDPEDEGETWKYRN